MLRYSQFDKSKVCPKTEEIKKWLIKSWKLETKLSSQGKSMFYQMPPLHSGRKIG